MNTDGLDLTGSYRIQAGDTGTFDFAFSGTYVRKYKYQQEQNGVYLQNAGVYSGTGPIFRWQHAVNRLMEQGPVRAEPGAAFQVGYVDQGGPQPVSDASFYNDSGPLTAGHLGIWLPLRPVRHRWAFETSSTPNPPLSDRTQLPAGYDPRFTDPAGRTY